MNEVYEKKRRELIKSMDMSDSQTMFEMHQAISAEWATALADKIDHFAEMGNSGGLCLVSLLLSSRLLSTRRKVLQRKFWLI